MFFVSKTSIRTIKRKSTLCTLANVVHLFIFVIYLFRVFLHKIINRAATFLNTFCFHPSKIVISRLSFLNVALLEPLKHTILSNFCNLQIYAKLWCHYDVFVPEINQITAITTLTPWNLRHGSHQSWKVLEFEKSPGNSWKVWNFAQILENSWNF